MNHLSVLQAIEYIKEGKLIIITDDADRENEGDLFIAAEKITVEQMGFIIRHTSGIVVIPMTSERLNALNLPQMVPKNTEVNRTAFTISVDFAKKTSTGISASDRVETIKALIDPNTVPEDLRRPGHVFPLEAKKGGVLKRSGHTEAAVDLCELAGLYPAGVICEILNEDGSICREKDLAAFSQKYNIPMLSIAELIKYRRSQEMLVEEISCARLPTQWGSFMVHVYESKLDGIQHLALVKGTIYGKPNVLVRVHSECLTGDVFYSLRCDCGIQLELAMQQIQKEGSGVILYLRGHEGRGIGLGHKIRAYTLQDTGLDTVEANLEQGFPVDSREYGIGAQILAHLGLTTIRLMTNNPHKYSGLKGYGLEITERIPILTKPNTENIRYLLTKQKKMGHWLNLKENTVHENY